MRRDVKAGDMLFGGDIPFRVARREDKAAPAAPKPPPVKFGTASPSLSEIQARMATIERRLGEVAAMVKRRRAQ
jgi:hypothetical protein